jgi:hypothetical protein
VHSSPRAPGSTPELLRRFEGVTFFHSYMSVVQMSGAIRTASRDPPLSPPAPPHTPPPGTTAPDGNAPGAPGAATGAEDWPEDRPEDRSDSQRLVTRRCSSVFALSVSTTPRDTPSTIPEFASSAPCATDGLVCAICLDELDSTAECTLPCGHQFHSVCVLKAFRRDERCPMCRSAPIEQEVAEADDSSNATYNAILMETMDNWQAAEAAERAMRNYHRRADRAVRREEPLARLRTSMRERHEASRVADAASTQVWRRVLKDAWRSEAMAPTLANERLARRRFTDARRRYDGALALCIGAPPEHPLFD